MNAVQACRRPATVQTEARLRGSQPRSNMKQLNDRSHLPHARTLSRWGRRRHERKVFITARNDLEMDTSEEDLEENKMWQRTRFEGVERMYSREGLLRLARARVAVVGVGGVGSWAAEALVRSGVGGLTLVDLDEICLSNCNRQVHAMQSTVGQFKAEVLQRRLNDINPSCDVTVVKDFLTEDNCAEILSPTSTGDSDGSEFDFVLDAIDIVHHKCALIDHCREKQIPVLCTGGTGGVALPFPMVLEDMTEACGNKLLTATRKMLRQRYDYPAGTNGHPNGKKKASIAKWDIPVIYFAEQEDVQLPSSFPINKPILASTSQSDSSGSSDVGDNVRAEKGRRLGCAGGSGSVVFVTGSLGFGAAAYIVNTIAADR